MFKPRFQITPETASALMQIEAVRRELSGLVIEPRFLISLRETATLQSTHFSTQIEGNRLTLPEVKEVLKGAKFPGRERDETEVRNHYLAFAHMETLADAQSDIGEKDIQVLHGLVLTGKRKLSPYRTQQNVIRDSGSGRIVYLPPEAPNVSALMKELVSWVKETLSDGTLPAPIIAALAHYQFATIHPYLDGNGRTARLLTTLILRRAGYGLEGIYSLDEHYATNLKAYYEAFRSVTTTTTKAVLMLISPRLSHTSPRVWTVPLGKSGMQRSNWVRNRQRPEQTFFGNLTPARGACSTSSTASVPPPAKRWQLT